MTNKEALRDRARQHVAGNAIVIDTETTAALWINREAEACEIALISADGLTIYESLIKTINPIDEETSKIHGITNEMCANAPTWVEIQPIIAEMIAGRAVLAYNAAFDRPVLENNARLSGIDLPRWEWGCLMEAYQRFISASKWQKLKVACHQIGYKFEGNEHRALADARAARAVLLHMAEWRPIEQELLIQMPRPSAVEMGE